MIKTYKTGNLMYEYIWWVTRLICSKTIVYFFLLNLTNSYKKNVCKMGNVNLYQLMLGLISIQCGK